MGKFEDSSTSKEKHITKIELQSYKIDWFNPQVMSSKCLKYLKKNKSIPTTHNKQLLFLMNTFETAQIKLSFSNVIGKIGHTATQLFYPLPGCK
jgi:hypothetical protein